MDKLIERLFIYHSMLNDYETGLKIKRNDKAICKLRIGFGYCWFLMGGYDIHVYGTRSFKTTLPELYAQKPNVVNFVNGHWFMPGNLEPRIQCLKDAIKLTEEKICLLEK